MSDDRNPSGQFAEPAFGQAGVERDAGFKSMPDPNEKEPGEELTVREAAEQHATESAAPIVRSYKDENGEDAPSNETLTLDRAAADLSEMYRTEAEAADKDAEAALLAELGIKSESDEQQPAKPARAESEAAAEPAPDEIDPDLEKALSNPKVVEAIKAQVGEADQARQQYIAAINAAVHVAQHSFVSQFPEFANTTSEQHPAIALNIAQQNPARWAAIQAAVLNTQNLFTAQHGEQQRATERDQAAFRDYATEQDKTFEAFVKDVPAARQSEVLKEIIAGAKEYGIEGAEIAKLNATDRTFRHAGFQRMMFEAAQYRLMAKSGRAAAAMSVPQVQRPGVRGAAPSGNEDAIRKLSVAFDRNPDVKNAAALYSARRARG